MEKDDELEENDSTHEEEVVNENSEPVILTEENDTAEISEVSETTPEPTTEPELVITTVKLWRLYNVYSGEHFYTSSEQERDKVYSAGWNIEGVGWVCRTSSNTPVYRLYNPNAGDHHYTASEKERDGLVKLGWQYEGVCWYANTYGQGIPVYREYNPNATSGNHNFTTSFPEHQKLVSIGWNDEGIAFYVESAGSSEGSKVNPSTLTVQYTPVYYAQGDGRWSSSRFGGYTLGSTGCSPTAQAMAIAGILGNGVTPADVASYLYNNTQEFNRRQAGSSGLAKKLGPEHWGLKTTGINSYDSLVSALNKGYIVLFAVGPGTFVGRGATHALVLFKNSNGNTYVYDPSNKHNGWYSISSIWNQRSGDSYDWYGGYVGYGICR